MVTELTAVTPLVVIGNVWVPVVAGNVMLEGICTTDGSLFVSEIVAPPAGAGSAPAGGPPRVAPPS